MARGAVAEELPRAPQEPAMQSAALPNGSEVGACARGAQSLNSELEGLALLLRGELDFAVAQYKDQVMKLVLAHGAQRGAGFEAARGAGADAVAARKEANPMEKTSREHAKRRQPPQSDAYFPTMTFDKDEEVKSRKSRSMKCESKKVDVDLEPTLTRYSGRCSSFFNLNAELRRRLTRIVSHRYFDGVFVFAIASNTLWFGVEAQYMASTHSATVPIGFTWVSQIYTIAFVIELILRLYTSGFRVYYCGPDSTWGVFDTVLVGLSIFEWCVTLVTEHFMGEEVDGTQNWTYIRFIRIARMVRTLRVIRLFSFLRSLRLLLLSVMHTLKSLFWTLIMLLMLLYLVGVLFTQAATQHLTVAEEWDGSGYASDVDKYYGSLAKSVYTLFKTLTNGISWQTVVEPLEAIHWLWAGLFLLYIAFAYFALLNVVTAVFCQTAIDNAQKDQDEVVEQQKAAENQYAEQLSQLFRDVDDDKSGELTLDEFEDMAQDERLIRYCASLDISLGDIWALFKLLDEDGSGSIGVDEFVKGCLKLRGAARSVDVALAGYQLRWVISRLEKFITYVDAQFKYLHDSMDLLAGEMDAHLPLKRLAAGSEHEAPVTRCWNPHLWAGPA